MPGGDPIQSCLVVGVDHHRSPVALRERLSAEGADAAELSRRLLAVPGCREAVVISTCNRFECWLGGEIAGGEVAMVLASRAGLDTGELGRHLYWHHGEAAVRHLFRVAAGLESLVLGEDQVAHQVRTAYEWSRCEGLTGPLFNPLFQSALAVSRQVRSTTALGRHKMSVPSIAVDLALRVHGDLAQSRLLVLGAGEMAELAVRYLLDHGVTRIGLVNRANERAMALAGLAHAKVWPWSELVPALAGHDIVVSSTSAPHVMVRLADVRAALDLVPKPMLFIDLAVPRDVDEAVGGLPGVHLYNVDHLEAVVAGNRQARAEGVPEAEAIIAAEVAAFVSAHRPGRDDLRAQVAAWLDGVVQAEEERLAGRLALPIERRQELRYGLERVAGKLTHRLLAYLARHEGEAEAEDFVRSLLAEEARTGRET